MPEHGVASARFWNTSSQGGSVEILSGTGLQLLQENCGVRAGTAVAQGSGAGNGCAVPRAPGCRQRFPWDARVSHRHQGKQGCNTRSGE